MSFSRVTTDSEAKIDRFLSTSDLEFNVKNGELVMDGHYRPEKLAAQEAYEKMRNAIELLRENSHLFDYGTKADRDNIYDQLLAKLNHAYLKRNEVIGKAKTYNVAFEKS